MKRFFTSILLVVFLSFSLFAQNANRTADTKIIDALNQLPAQNEALYNRLMSDIASTGDEGLQMLLDKLAAKDAGSIKAEYAISGLVAFSTASSFSPEMRKSITDALTAAAAKTTDETIRGFLAKELMVLGLPQAKIEQTPILSVKDAAKALKKAAAVAKKNPSEKNIADRCVALKQYITAAGVVDAEKEILKAVKDPCREYRFAALYAVSEDGSAIMIDKIAEQLPVLASKGNEEPIMDIVWWLGANGNGKHASYVKPYITSENLELVRTAAMALAAMGNKSTLSDVSSLLTSADPLRVNIAEDCLKSYPGEVCRAIVPLFLRAEAGGQAAIINIIAQRRSLPDKPLVLDNLSCSSASVAAASYNALKAVAQQSDFVLLCTLLEDAPQEYVLPVQDALLEALSSLPREERYAAFVKRQEIAPSQKQALYWPMIISSANIEQLFAICASGNNPQAFTTLLKRISASKAPGAQQLLQLRRAMEVASEPAQKVAVLNSVAGTDTFLGIIYAGRFIEDADLQQAAVQAIRRIATGNKSYNGPEVTALLRRAAEVISGPDAEYEKTDIALHLESLPAEEGFVSMFNGKDLSLWQGLTTSYKKKKGLDNPFARAKLTDKELAGAQEAADKLMAETWKVENGNIVFFGSGYDNLCTIKKYGDFEMYVDWLLYPEGPEADAGIYLRGTPQVQIWDTARVNVGAQVGSGGLYNNKTNPSEPLCVADNGLGLWNSFYIKMVGERVTVYLNGVLVTDNVILENYWDRSQPIFPVEQIELQAHGSKVAYRDLYIRELPQVQPVELSAEEKAEGFEMLFDGTGLNKWIGNKHDYVPENGLLAVHPSEQGFGDLYTAKEYGDFVFRFEFKLTPGANNGVGIRAPGTGDAAYEGMEIQILDHFNAIYQPGLRDYQYHGSVYGIIPAQNQNALKPVGEWNTEEIYACGNHIRVTLNGVVITEGDIKEATENGTYDHKEHPGLFRPAGHIGFLGHGSELWFRNIRVKEIK